MAQRMHFDVRDLTRIAVFAAIIAVLGLPAPISIFGGAVPITAQTLGVMLAGAILGRWRGAAAVTTLLVLVAVGLPLLAGGHGGIGAFVGPTAGYLFGWIAGAFVTGLIVHGAHAPRGEGRGGAARPSWWRTALGCVVGGILVVYAFGVPVSAFATGLPLPQMALSSLVFVPGDLLKAVVATIVTLALWRAYPRAFGAGSADAATRLPHAARAGSIPDDAARAGSIPDDAATGADANPADTRAGVE